AASRALIPSRKARRTFRYSSTVKMPPPSLLTERAYVAEFYSAGSGTIPPLPWQTFPPPISPVFRSERLDLGCWRLHIPWHGDDPTPSPDTLLSAGIRGRRDGAAYAVRHGPRPNRGQRKNVRRV